MYKNNEFLVKMFDKIAGIIYNPSGLESLILFHSLAGAKNGPL